MRRRLLAPLLLAPLLAAPAVVPAQAAPDAPPSVQVSVVKSGLQIPWDLAVLPDGSLLYTERSLKKLTLLKTGDPQPRTILDSPAGMWSSGETGLMSVELAADFATTREFITCHGYKSGSTQDVRVVRWRFDESYTGATKVKTLVSGLPSRTGRHGGCALVKGAGNGLLVGTGDAATGRNPQSRTSGGGKVLRIDATTGLGLPGNPYADSSVAIKRRLYTYGHRNVQGLARRADGTIWSVEHGSYRDDEVNRLVKGGNYGWNPVPRRSGDPSYNEGSNSPMTDFKIPGTQRAAAWDSGDPTFATSGAAFLDDPQWGAWQGALAVAALKDSSLRLMRFTAGGSLVDVKKLPELDETYGRLRGVVPAPDGGFYVTTSNGTDDKILKVRANLG